jgi:hypothetical protein
LGSVLFTLAVTVERYQAVRNPLSSQNKNLHKSLLYLPIFLSIAFNISRYIQYIVVLTAFIGEQRTVK